MDAHKPRYCPAWIAGQITNWAQLRDNRSWSNN